MRVTQFSKKVFGNIRPFHLNTKIHINAPLHRDWNDTFKQKPHAIYSRHKDMDIVWKNNEKYDSNRFHMHGIPTRITSPFLNKTLRLSTGMLLISLKIPSIIKWNWHPKEYILFPSDMFDIVLATNCYHHRPKCTNTRETLWPISKVIGEFMSYMCIAYKRASSFIWQFKLHEQKNTLFKSGRVSRRCQWPSQIHLWYASKTVGFPFLPRIRNIFSLF